MSILTAYDKFVQVALKYMFSMFGTPKTGQTIEYQNGDDGHYQKGYPKIGTRFTDNDDGTITDNATGLMWVKDGTGAGCNNGNYLIWPEAIFFCEALNFAGHTDWRLPNVKELQSIVDYERVGPSIDPLFVNCQSDFYWSSTTYADGTDLAWFAYFNDGDIGVDIKDLGTYFVRPVRSGQ